MNRRGFLKALVGGVAAAAAVQSFPFRVFSFPSQIKIPTFGEYVEYCNFSSFAINESIDKMYLDIAEELGRSAGMLVTKAYETGYPMLAFSN
jgi:hypothetical protein